MAGNAGRGQAGFQVHCLHKGDLLHRKGLNFVERTILNDDFHHPPELKAEAHSASELWQRTQIRPLNLAEEAVGVPHGRPFSRTGGSEPNKEKLCPW